MKISIIYKEDTCRTLITLNATAVQQDLPIMEYRFSGVEGALGSRLKVNNGRIT